MILVGRYMSPFVRRTAVAMRLYGIGYEHRELSTADHADEIRAINPVGRVPALELDDGEVLIDSGAIIDYLDELAPREVSLIPREGRARRDVLKLTAIAHGMAEKGVASFYERTRRPQDKVYPEWVDYLEGQIHGALAALDQAADGRHWLVGSAISLADVTATCAYDFLRMTSPDLFVGEPYPHLAALAARCDALPAFHDTRP